MVRNLSSLRGSSAEALQVVGDLVDNDRRTLSEFAELGSDLFGVAELLRGEPALRRAVTDVSAAPEARTALVEGLLRDKVGSAALEVLALAAGLRWVVARDLADALEHLGVVATARSAGARDAGRLAEELFEVAQAVEESSGLRHALSDPARSPEDKAGLLREILGDRVLAATSTLVEQALAGSFRSFHAAITEYQKVAADTQGEAVALVRTAQALSADEQNRLGAALSAQYGRNVHLNIDVDPDLLGGLRVEIGDDVIDGTVVARLDDARRRIAG
jgi:F-type H+-transporting ATPase subunit delta